MFENLLQLVHKCVSSAKAIPNDAKVLLATDQPLDDKSKHVTTVLKEKMLMPTLSWSARTEEEMKKHELGLQKLCSSSDTSILSSVKTVGNILDECDSILAYLKIQKQQKHLLSESASKNDDKYCLFGSDVKLSKYDRSERENGCNILVLTKENILEADSISSDDDLIKLQFRVISESSNQLESIQSQKIVQNEKKDANGDVSDGIIFSGDIGASEDVSSHVIMDKLHCYHSLYDESKFSPSIPSLNLSDLSSIAPEYILDVISAPSECSTEDLLSSFKSKKPSGTKEKEEEEEEEEEEDGEDSFLSQVSNWAYAIICVGVDEEHSFLGRVVFLSVCGYNSSTRNHENIVQLSPKSLGISKTSTRSQHLSQAAECLSHVQAEQCVQRDLLLYLYNTINPLTFLQSAVGICGMGAAGSVEEAMHSFSDVSAQDLFVAENTRLYAHVQGILKSSITQTTSSDSDKQSNEVRGKRRVSDISQTRGSRNRCLKQINSILLDNDIQSFSASSLKISQLMSLISICVGYSLHFLKSQPLSTVKAVFKPCQLRSKLSSGTFPFVAPKYSSSLGIEPAGSDHVTSSTKSHSTSTSLSSQFLALLLSSFSSICKQRDIPILTALPAIFFKKCARKCVSSGAFSSSSSSIFRGGGLSSRKQGRINVGFVIGLVVPCPGFVKLHTDIVCEVIRDSFLVWQKERRRDGGVSCHESNSGASTSQKEEDIAGNFIHVKEWYKIIPEYSQQFKSIDEDSSINRNEKKEEEGEGEKKERGKNATKEGDSLEGEENGEDVELETLTVSCGIVPRIPSVCASTSQKEEDIAGNFIHVKEWYKIIPEYSQQFKSIDEDSSINRNEKKEEEGEGEKKERGKNATKEGDSLEGEENGEDVELETLTKGQEEEEARDEEKEDGVSVVEVEEEINEPQETQEDAKKEKKTKMPKKTSKAKSLRKKLSRKDKKRMKRK
ncbi:hypothetical protein ADUPG1_013091 [Aduncisulcus paluster]|uniref:Uncharacterized protein n=1 Tax=Aduncisulcus paluster TaxID=2918883 RepID=A0ABQ5K1Q6_9EUKA|nr:hypothetical protein ADUPG1_013091 [Aduncisulcus paluster]